MATAAPARPQTAPTHYAGFWIRFVAVVIDAIIIGIVNSVVGAVFGLRGAMPSLDGDPVVAIAAIAAVASKMLLVGEACALRLVRIYIAVQPTSLMFAPVALANCLGALVPSSEPK